jgi:hypothetical protein
VAPCVPLLDVLYPASQFFNGVRRSRGEVLEVRRVRRFGRANAARCILPGKLLPEHVRWASVQLFLLLGQRVRAAGQARQHGVPASAMFRAV